MYKIILNHLNRTTYYELCFRMNYAVHIDLEWQNSDGQLLLLLERE